MTVVVAPGRVNLIGDHVDYVGGLALPCAIELAVTATVTRAGDAVDLTSDATAEHARFALADARVAAEASTWVRLVHAVVGALHPTTGVTGRLTTTLPIGSGLSSSAACTIALCLAVGFDGDERALVLAAQAAEQEATGVPCGTLDQLAIVHGLAGHALIVDATALTADPVPVPAGVAIAVIPSGHHRELSDTPYAQRRAEAEAAVAAMGGVANATLADAEALGDALLRRRARHVVTENMRVRAMADAFAAGDAPTAGALMLESHRSLRRDAEVSTHDLDSLVDALSSRAGVFGARLTGAGFGGSVVALVAADVAAALAETFGGRVVTPSDGARVVEA
ncbi:MAG TPA: galactokinase family protein [Acidimicrobiales bacterium]|nr:galactokinase family protein [Acidimicrobiales bacterium]